MSPCDVYVQKLALIYHDRQSSSVVVGLVSQLVEYGKVYRGMGWQSSKTIQSWAL